MSALWRGSLTTRLRIASGLVLFVYVVLHLLNIGMALISPAAADVMQDIRGFMIRSVPGTVILYGALGTHVVLALGKFVLGGNLRLKLFDWVQVVFGVTIPLLLLTHVVFTRGSHEMFETNDTVAYVSGLIWGTYSGWQQGLLLVVTWVHGCMGIHYWLRRTSWWRRHTTLLAMSATVLPLFARAGFISEGRRAQGIMAEDGPASAAFFEETNWPNWDQFASLIQTRDVLWWSIVAVWIGAIAVFAARQIIRRRRASLTITYADGPKIQVAPGPTLLEISQAANVPHTALCGGRGRCTTCRVIVEAGAEHLPPPTDAETKALAAAGAPANARLACQLTPTRPLTVYRLFRPDGRQSRRHASEGKEAQLAILFLDMRGFTSRTTGQLPYDIVHLLNRFFDAIVPPINAAGGMVDKYLGDGLLAVFETSDATSSAQAGLRAAVGIGEALERFNEELALEDVPPVRIGLSLHLGTVVIGEIGAAGQAPRTLIGDTVNAASRLEAQTKELAVEGLISTSVLTAAGVSYGPDALITLTLRGVAEPVSALPVPTLAKASFEAAPRPSPAV